MALFANNEVCLVCNGCPQKITNRQYMKCSECNFTYDLICANVSENRFYLMDPEKKEQWKCTPCISKKPKICNVNTPVGNQDMIKRCKNFDENVTVRKAKKMRRLSLDRLSLTSNIADYSFEDATSTPNTKNIQENENSIRECVQLKELKNVVEELTNHLIKAKEENNSLQLENNKLRQVIEQFNGKNTMEENIQKAHLTDSPLLIPKTRKRTSKNKIALVSTQSEKNTLNLAQNLDSTNSCAEATLTTTCGTKGNNNYTKQDTTQTDLKPSYAEVARTLQAPKILDRQLNSRLLDRDLTSKPKNRRQSTMSRPKIVIVGDQSCRGLASSITTLRAKYRNVTDYDVINFTFPNAPTDHILHNFVKSKVTLREEDWLILCVGSNDTNPTKFFIEVSSILKVYNKPRVIVSEIFANRHLSEDKLNQSLRKITINFKNAHYLVNQTSKSINYLINTCDYECTYIGKNIRKSLQHEVISKPTFQRKNTGTIPHYFQQMNKRKSNIDVTNTGNGKKPITDSLNVSRMPPKPGTIPFYFQRMPLKKYTNNINQTNKSAQKNVTQFFRH